MKLTFWHLNLTFVNLLYPHLKALFYKDNKCCYILCKKVKKNLALNEYSADLFNIAINIEMKSYKKWAQ